MPNKPHDDALEEAGVWAKHYFLASRTLMESILRPYDLGQTQWYVMHLLATDGSLAQRDLPTTIGIQRATLSSIVGALVRKGLVTQEGSATDQRQKTLALTDAGRELWQRLPDPIDVIATVAFGDVDPEDLATTNRVLREATARLNAYREKEL